MTLERESTVPGDEEAAQEAPNPPAAGAGEEVEAELQSSVPSSTNDPMRAALFEGYIDAIEDGRIYGWALDTSDKSNRLSVSIFHGSDHLGTLVADRYRADLVGYGDGSGQHAFVFDVPKALRSEPADEFLVVFSNTDIPLLRGKRAKTDAVEEIYPIETGDVDPQKLAARLEATERTLIGLIRIVHPNVGSIGEVQAKTKQLEDKIRESDETGRMLETILIRMDETIKTITDRVDALEQGRNRGGSRRTGWLMLGVLVVLIAAMGTYAFLGWPMP